MHKHFDEASLFLPLPKPVVRPGEFVFSAMHLDHAHIIGMCGALRDAGATLKSVYDPDPAKVADFCRSFPDTRPAASEREILDDPEVRMVAAAAVTCERADLGIRVMAAGKVPFLVNSHYKVYRTTYCLRSFQICSCHEFRVVKSMEKIPTDG